MLRQLAVVSACLFAFTLRAAAISPQEQAALLAFFNATGGPTWNYTQDEQQRKWFTAGLNECDWAGVSCNPARTEVQGIALAGHNLVGSMPPEVGQFNHLVTLVVSQNPHLGGGIPSEITQTTLENFFADGNSFSGGLNWLGGLPRLQKLSIRFNRLEGAIPTAIGALSALQEFQLEANRLDGPVPVELGQLSQLRLLNLTGNQLQGQIPGELGNLHSLSELRLNQNQLSGSIPDSLGSLTQLSVLDLGANQLSGAIPPSLGGLAQLTQLSVGQAHLSGSLPASLGALAALRILSVGTNELSGQIPPELGNLRNLEELYLDRNHFVGPVPDSFGNLKVTRILNVASNSLEGVLPDALIGMTSLQSIDLGWNALYSGKSSLRDFIDARSGGPFELTQTVAPKAVKVFPRGRSSIQVQWEPIAFTGHDGGYRVSIAPDPSGPFSVVGTTSDKSQRFLNIGGLTAGVTVYVTVKTFTLPHPANANEVISAASAALAGTPAPTGSAGTLQFQLGTLTGSEGDTRTVTVSRLNGNSGSVSAIVIAQSATARLGADFAIISNPVLRWSDGDDHPKTITVDLFQDARAEGTEAFTLNLVTVRGGAQLGTPATETATIGDVQIGDGVTPVDSAGVDVAAAEDSLGNRLVVSIQPRDGARRVYCRAFSPNGLAIGDNALLSELASTQDAAKPNVVATVPGEFTVAWEEAGVIRGRTVYIKASDVHFGPPRKIVLTGASLVARNGVAVDPRSHKPLVVWVSGQQVFGQFLSRLSAPLGVPFRLDGSSSGTVRDAVVAYLTDGSTFLVSWEQNTPAGSAVLARAFNPDASARGVEVLMDQPTAPPQSAPRVAGSRNSFLAIWRRGPLGTRSAFSELVAATVAPDGSPADLTTLSSDTYQTEPAIATSAAGDCIAVWLEEQTSTSPQAKTDVIPGCLAPNHHGARTVLPSGSSTTRTLAVTLRASGQVTVFASQDDPREGDGGLVAAAFPEE